MADAALVILATAVGVAADLGIVNLLARLRALRQKDRIRKAARLGLVLGAVAVLLAAVPVAAYYACALVAVPDDGYAAGWLLILAGLIVFIVSANQDGYHRDLERREAENHHRRKPIRRRDR
jgi:O-antigen/teichoic acid export membrane protein